MATMTSAPGAADVWNLMLRDARALTKISFIAIVFTVAMW